MPNYDAGHYFLTVLAPVRMDPMVVDGQSRSRRHAIREALAAMPAGERSVVSQGAGQDNPFARTTLTHFTRMFVIDDVTFNGRVGADSLVSQVRKTNLLIDQRVDRLATPFLAWMADFDAAGDAPADLRAYLTALWSTMQSEMQSVFQHCVGFEAVVSANDFCDYIARCQVETTMPFNDYWSVPPGLRDVALTPYIWAGGGAVAAGLVLALLLGKAWLLLLGVLALAGVVYLAYGKILAAANKPFPKVPAPAPAADLPSVLKALYLQRAFTEFAIATQVAGAVDLHVAFAAFLADHAPDNLTAPTQVPGVIGV